MPYNTQIDNKMHSTDNSSILSAVVGFFVAIGNHLFGWLNNIQITAHWDEWFQAIITGALGAVAAYLATKFMRFIETKIKKIKKHQL